MDVRAPAHINAFKKRSVEQLDAKPDDAISTHVAASDAEMDRLRSLRKLKRLASEIAQAKLDAKLALLEQAKMDDEIVEAQATASGDSNRSRSEHGAPVRKGITSGDFAVKIAQRRFVDGAMRSSQASSAPDLRDEGAVAPVPVLLAILAFPQRLPSSDDVDVLDRAPVARPAGKADAQ